MFSYFHPLNKLERCRQSWQKRNDVLHFLKPLIADPFPQGDSDAREARYLVIDFETTGLNPDIDRILSIGTIELEAMKMDMRSATHVFIDESQVNPETVVIHHILPETGKNSGSTLDAAMAALFSQMEGKVLLAHGVGVESGFISAYLERRFGIQQFPFVWLDTLALEKSLLANQRGAGADDYTLSGTRSRYGLPEYPAHEALTDAVATGELYLVLMKKIYGRDKARFGDLYLRSHH